MTKVQANGFPAPQPPALPNAAFVPPAPEECIWQRARFGQATSAQVEAQVEAQDAKALRAAAKAQAIAEAQAAAEAAEAALALVAGAN